MGVDVSFDPQLVHQAPVQFGARMISPVREEVK